MQSRQTVPRFLSKQQVEQYHEQGFVAPVDVMSEDEAAGYLQRLQAAEIEYPHDLNAENRIILTWPSAFSMNWYIIH